MLFSAIKYGHMLYIVFQAPLSMEFSRREVWNGYLFSNWNFVPFVSLHPFHPPPSANLWPPPESLFPVPGSLETHGISLVQKAFLGKNME